MWRAASRALSALTMLSLVGAGAPTTTLTIVGYNDMDEMLAALAARYAVHHPRTRFVLNLKSTRSAPGALTAGASDLAPMGAPMTAEDLAAFRAAWGGAPVAVRVAHDSLTPGTLSSPTGVLVQADAPLVAIRLSAVRRAFTAEGPPLRWRDLGARGARADRSVRLVGLSADTAIGRFVLDRLGATRFASAYRGLPQSREVAAAVAADPDAIGLANLNHAGGTVRALDLVDNTGRRSRPDARTIVAGHYPFDRQLLVYVRPGPGGERHCPAYDFLRFMLSGEGQRLIARGAKGYLPLSAAERAIELAKLRQ